MDEESTSTTLSMENWTRHAANPDLSLKSDLNDSDPDVKQVAEKVINLDREINNLNVNLRSAQEQNKKLQFALNKQDNKLSKLKTQLMEGLGLFVAFITFISATVTIFSKAETITSLIVLMFSMLLCMLIFVYAFVIIMDMGNTKTIKHFWWLCGIVVLLGIVGYGGLFLYERNIVDIITKVANREMICINCLIDKEGNVFRSPLLLRPVSK